MNAGKRDLIPGETLNLLEDISNEPDAIVSKVLRKHGTHSLTLFAHAGQEIDRHSSAMDALLLVLEGNLKVDVDGRKCRLASGELVHLPATVPHALAAPAASRFLLFMLPAEAANGGASNA